MKKLLLAAGLGGAIAALTLGLSTDAKAAPAGVGSAEDTVRSLEGSGYRVIVDKIGSRPLDQCTVASVQPGRASTQAMSEDEAPTGQAVLLTARC